MNQSRQPASWHGSNLPEPDAETVLAGIGRYLEDVTKVLKALGDAGVDRSTREHVGFSIAVLGFLEHAFKTRGTSVRLDFDRVNRRDLLLRLCNQGVSATGVAHVLGLDMEQGMQTSASSRCTGGMSHPVLGSQKVGMVDRAAALLSQTGKEQPHE